MTAPAGRPPVVLVVDDDATVRCLAREALEPAGFAVEGAADGREALTACECRRPAIVLLDLPLPDTDGFALCERLRALPGGEDLPVLIVTWLEDVASITRAYEVGATDFVTKPINWAILRHRLRYVLRASEAFAATRRDGEALMAKNGELDSFVYRVSHDLKAPLVALQGLTSALAEDHGGALDAEARYCIERICANTEQMERLIRDLLALSRVGREARPPERVDLAELVDDVLAELAERVRARGVAVSRHGLPVVRGIHVQLEQVWRNLLDNALKYLGDTPVPAVEIGSTDRGNLVECFVRDNGIGIDPPYHDRVFEIFERLKEIDVEGTGVGLAIVKKIVEGVGGRVWVESAKGTGATFRFTWPKEASTPPGSSS